MPFQHASTPLLLALAAMLCACTYTGNYPAETYDGLVLVPDTQFAQVYRRPGADLAGYEAYDLEHCEVAFRKDWLRSQNSGRIDLGSRVTQKDVDTIKDALGDLCDTYFREALGRAPAYPLVASYEEGQPVLVLRPEIINLDINAPDIKSSSMTRTYTTGAGEMTLALEIVDGTTGEILYRIVDRRRSTETHYLQWTNSVTNQAEASRWLRGWANQLRQGLDAVRASASAGT
jgi:hypothetical protein